MGLDVRVAVVDDMQMHRSMLQQAFASINKTQNMLNFVVAKEYTDGAHLLADNETFDLITLDIRMPEKDGLSTLLLLRKKMNIRTPICMVSSENDDNIDRFTKLIVSDQVRNMTEETKLKHMAKIEERLITDNQEEGKINSLLEGCEKLVLSPLTYAEHLGANGFLKKPYSIQQAQNVLPEVINGKSFTATTCLGNK